MNKEIKDVLQLLALILPSFALVIFGWLHSPMYADTKAKDRLNAQDYLRKSYFFPNPFFDREAMIKDYSFADNEINPSVLIEQFINKTHQDAN